MVRQVQTLSILISQCLCFFSCFFRSCLSIFSRRRAAAAASRAASSSRAFTTSHGVAQLLAGDPRLACLRWAGESSPLLLPLELRACLRFLCRREDGSTTGDDFSRGGGSRDGSRRGGGLRSSRSPFPFPLSLTAFLSAALSAFFFSAVAATAAAFSVLARSAASSFAFVRCEGEEGEEGDG